MPGRTNVQSARCRHHWWRPQRAGHRLLPGQSRIQAAGAGAPRSTRWRCHHGRIPSRLPLLHSGTLGGTTAARHCPRHATGKAWPEHDQDRRGGHRTVTRRPRAHSLPRYGKSRPGNRGVLPEGCDQVSSVPVVARQDGPGHWQGAHPGPARHRQSQFRRSVGNAQHRPRSSQTGPARHVPPAALGADGGG